MPKRLPKCQDPPREKAHWDYLLEEMTWLATDFAQERKWKKNAAKKCAAMVMKYHRDKEAAAERAKKDEQSNLKRIASTIAKEIRSFWSLVEKLAEAKQNSIIEKKKKQAADMHLKLIVDQTEEYTDVADGKGCGKIISQILLLMPLRPLILIRRRALTVMMNSVLIRTKLMTRRRLTGRRGKQTVMLLITRRRSLNSIVRMTCLSISLFLRVTHLPQQPLSLLPHLSRPPLTSSLIRRPAQPASKGSGKMTMRSSVCATVRMGKMTKRQSLSRKQKNLQITGKKLTHWKGITSCRKKN